jgi:hypothetical protein
MWDDPGIDRPEARAVCEHFFASHCFRGMHIRLCMLCHEPDWDDLEEQIGRKEGGAMTVNMEKINAFANLRILLDQYVPSRELSLARTKLDECLMWLDRCEPTAEAIARELAGKRPVETITNPVTGETFKPADLDKAPVPEDTPVPEPIPDIPGGSAARDWKIPPLLCTSSGAYS